jgi:methionyl aminopeptidase
MAMIHLYSSSEIEKIAAAGKILANVFRQIIQQVKVGVALKDLDDLACRLIKKAGAEPAFLGYQPNAAKHPFPYSICASLNEVVVHGKPTDYKLKSGDVLKIDCGIKIKGFYSDAAVTVGLGNISPEAKKLIDATKLALEKSIEQAKPGNHLGDIGWVIQETAKKAGVKVIKELTGHGIGKELHEPPTIYNFGGKGQGIKLKSGMVLAIEPMFAIGADKIIQKKDESWATRDNSLSAHFEHTVAITPKGCHVLTTDILRFG